MPIYRIPGYTEPASYTYTKKQWEIIRQDRTNRNTPFTEKQFYPADLFILKGFDSKGQPIWERNPRWHDDGFYIGNSGRSA